jgi:nucleotide-binding universal stress UspA family protein
MDYMSLMVHLELGRGNESVLSVAADLAERFGASVIGIAAVQPTQPVYGNDCYVPPALMNEDRDDIARMLKAAETEFRSALEGRAKSLEWRATTGFVALDEYITSQARCADLVISSVPSDSVTSPARHVDAGALVMQLGRPLLAVPSGKKGLKLEQVLVAWKDSRESRRAIADALPLLQKAGGVCVVSITTEIDYSQRQLDDVVCWLGRHGVTATTQVSHAHSDHGGGLNAVAQSLGADLIVAGAYGHSRVREYVLGGVTRGLLHRPQLCSLLSH